jgi:hypothetical protein
MAQEPVGELDARFSSEGASALPWTQAQQGLRDAEVYWLSTVRADGRPHVTPLIGVWLDSALYFCTGPTEQKARNLEHSLHCALTTGCNALDEGLDLVVEGDAVRLRDDDRLRVLATAFEDKYGSVWHFDVHDGAFHGEGGEALVFEVAPGTVFGFRKGAYSQTRWRFARG